MEDGLYGWGDQLRGYCSYRIRKRSGLGSWRLKEGIGERGDDGWSQISKEEGGTWLHSTGGRIHLLTEGRH